jgi:NodT family efflux transporter outer membrane factor (OMF) lipoprotein
MRRFAPLALAAALAGCTVGPNYKAEVPALPPAFAGPQPIGPAPEVDLARWWTAFDDPELQRLIAIGMRQAPDLQLAASRVRQARTQIVVARAAGLPEIDAAANGQYQKFKRLGGGGDIGELLGRFNGAGTGGTGATAGGAAQDQSFPDSLKLVSTGFDATWMVDLFGGARRQLEEARDQADAALWNQRAARIMLAGEIANDYFQMRSYQAQARIASAEADRQARALSIIEHTSQVGLVPQGNASRQRTNLATARAQVAPLDAQALTQIDAIAVLIGEAPEALIDELKVARPLPSTPPVVPPGLPVDLIRRRPDVRAAERQLAAATAEIGVNVAQLYPQISLTAMPQLAGIWLGGFFLGKTLQLSAQGAATFPLLDFGRRRAQVRGAEEAREQAYIQWRQAVLGALRDVEDALVRFEGERRSNVELASGVVDARRSLAVNEAQFRTGIQNLQPVLDAQNQLLQIQNAQAQSDARLRQAVASLYLALGGGWSDADADPVRPMIVDQPKGVPHD